MKNLLKKYGKGQERKTEIKLFEVIQAKQVAIANTKLYVNREDGFIGTGLKKDEFVTDCSDLDDIIVFTQRGNNESGESRRKDLYRKGYYSCRQYSRKMMNEPPII